VIGASTLGLSESPLGLDLLVRQKEASTIERRVRRAYIYILLTCIWLPFAPINLGQRPPPSSPRSSSFPHWELILHVSKHGQTLRAQKLVTSPLIKIRNTPLLLLLLGPAQPFSWSELW